MQNFPTQGAVSPLQPPPRGYAPWTPARGQSPETPIVGQLLAPPPFQRLDPPLWVSLSPPKKVECRPPGSCGVSTSHSNGDDYIYYILFNRLVCTKYSLIKSAMNLQIGCLFFLKDRKVTTGRRVIEFDTL